MNKLDSHEEWICMAEQKYVSELALLASELSVRARLRLLAAVQQQVKHPSVCAVERTRVALTRLLIALIPESWKTIRGMMQERKGTKQDEEVRFSLFCSLDELPSLAGGRELSSEAARLVGEYLRRAKSNTAQAAWMAGDLLGDHWDPRESVPVLINVLTSGKYAEGRLSALHGLEHAMGHEDCSGKARDSIRRVVRRAASNDRSGRVRESAKRVRDQVSGCSPAV